MTADEVVRLLGLQPLEPEGGFFKEIYRHTHRLPAPAGFEGKDRALATSIYYLITPSTFSAMHRVRSDEIFHFYMGDAVEQLHLLPDGSGSVVTIGTDLSAGERPQVLVPAGVWQGARLREGGQWALLGTTVSPGFEFIDYEHGDKAALISQYPDFQTQIERLSPSS